MTFMIFADQFLFIRFSLQRDTRAVNATSSPKGLAFPAQYPTLLYLPEIHSK